MEANNETSTIAATVAAATPEKRKLPKPRKVKIEAGRITTVMPKTGIEQLGRSLGDKTSLRVAEMTQSIYKDGFDASRGPAMVLECKLPEEVFATAKPEDIIAALCPAPLIGNRRSSALATAATEKPNDFADFKVEYLVYPALSDVQRSELLDRESATTLDFNKWDWYKRSQLRWAAVFKNGGRNEDDEKEDEVTHIVGLGLGRALDLWPGCIGEHALVKTPAGWVLKPGFGPSDVWAEGKGGNRTDTAQTGKVLARCHPEVVKRFFEGQNDPKRRIAYRKLIALANAWSNAGVKKKGQEGDGDLDLRPDLASMGPADENGNKGPATLAQIAEEYPDSKLIQEVAEMDASFDERAAGATGKGKSEIGMMSKPDLVNFLNANSKYKYMTRILKAVLRGPGCKDKAHRERLDNLAIIMEGFITGPALAIIKEMERAESDAKAANIANTVKEGANEGN